MTDYLTRLRTYYEVRRFTIFNTSVNIFPNKEISVHELAKAGFQYEGKGDDTVRCAFCKVRLCEWKKSDVPLEEHRRAAPFCSYLKFFEN